METARYEGTVQITSAEYRELITEAVEAVKNFERARSENWQLESKIRSLETELAEVNKEIDLYKAQQASYLANPFYTGMAKKSAYINQADPKTNITEEV